MSKDLVQRSENIFSLILRFYPKSYRQEFGEEMKFVFSESLKDANKENGEGLINFWSRTILDSGKSILKENIENKKGGENMKNKNFIRPLAVTIGILSVALLGALFVDGWDWSPFDFILMGTLIFGTGFLVEIANMKIKNKNHVIIAAVAIVAALLVVWVHLAVGIVDTLPFAGS